MATSGLGVTFAVGAATTASVAHTFATVGDKVKSLKGSLKGLNAESQAVSRLLTSDDALRKARLEHIAAGSAATKGALDRAQRAFDSAEKHAKKYNVTIADAAKTHARVTAEIEKTGKALSFNEKLQANQARRKDLQGQMMGVAAAVLAVSAPMKMAADAEQIMADVSNATRLDDEQFEPLKKKLLELPSLYGGSLEQVATIAARGGYARIANSELEAFTITGQKMVAAWKMSAEDAADALTGMRNNFNLTQQQTGGFLDSITNLANNMRKGSGGAIMEFTGRMSELAKVNGISRQQTAALGATWAELDIPAKKAIGATQAMYHALGQAKTASPAAQQVFTAMGTTGANIQARFRKDAQGTMLEVLKGLQRWEGPARARMSASLFGEGSEEAVTKLIGKLDTYRTALDLVGNEEVAAGTFQKQYEKYTNTTKGALELLENSARNLGVTIGSVMLKPLAGAAAILQTVINPVAALVDKFPVLTGTIMTLAVSFAAIKLTTLGAMYAGTMVSDGFLLVKKGAEGVWSVVSRLPVLFQATTYQMLWQRGVALTTAAALKIKTAALWVARAGWQALNLAMSSSPIGIIIRVVALVAAGLWMLYETCEPVRNAIDWVISGIKDGFWGAVKTVAIVYDKISGFFGKKSTMVGDLDAYLGKTEEVAKAAAKIPETKSVTATTAGISTADLTLARSSAPAGAAPGRVPSASSPMIRSAPSGGSINPQITFSLNFNGVPSQDVGDILVKAIKEKERDLTAYFEKMIADIASNQRRLAYGN
ncbi:MAG: phage tail tape measure protein [Desulfobulbus sp.]|nr:phage tail tape measure protein [Desulfobulbus sp.]